VEAREAQQLREHKVAGLCAAHGQVDGGHITDRCRGQETRLYTLDGKVGLSRGRVKREMPMYKNEK
jgi:hypothetical protein